MKLWGDLAYVGLAIAVAAVCYLGFAAALLVLLAGMQRVLGR